MESHYLLINCIYTALEGEGIRIGSPQIFIRLQGCSIGCENCDSKETWDFNENAKMYLTEILSEVKNLKLKTVSITGGDPLDHRHLKSLKILVEQLKNLKYFINIEASGLKISDEIFSIVDFISFDFKTPSTGVRTPLKNLMDLSERYAHKSQVKAVIANQKDFSAVYDCYNANPQLTNLSWVLTPCYEPGSTFPMELIKNISKWIIELNAPFRMIMQQHKIIYGPNERKV